jgi:hypothetical protein
MSPPDLLSRLDVHGFSRMLLLDILHLDGMKNFIYNAAYYPILLLFLIFLVALLFFELAPVLPLVVHEFWIFHVSKFGFIFVKAATLVLTSTIQSTHFAGSS